MRKTLLILALLLSSIAIFAQAPSYFKYQGVARDVNNLPFINTTLGMKITIIKDAGNGSGSGIVQYAEKHLVATSPIGIFSLHVGDGETTYGDIQEINWGSDAYWLKVEMDVNGGENYVFMGNSPILPVPFAMHAMTVEDKDDADADPENELQTLFFDANNNTLSLSNGGQVDLSSLQGGGGGSDNQTLQLNGTTLSIENGNQINLAAIQDGTEDADADPENEIQSLVFDENTNTLSLSDGGEVDLSTLEGGAGSDEQNLQLIGTNLFIENGNQVDLAAILDGTEDADADPENELQTISFDVNTNELTISEGNTIAIPTGQADADADPQNELQTLVFDENTNTLSLSDGGEVDLSALEGGAGSDEQTLTLDGTNLSIENGNQVDLAAIQDGTEDDDADPENELQTISFDPNTNELTISEGNTIAIPAGQADADADPENEIQELAFDVNTLELTISAGNTVHIPLDVDDNDHSPFNEFQTIEFNDNVLSLSDGGGEVDLNGLAGGDDADADPENEIQELAFDVNTLELTISAGNSVHIPLDVDDNDHSPFNEFQTIELNDNILTLSDAGGQVDLSGLGGDDADADPTNEFQTLNYVAENGKLILSDGNTVILPVDDIDPNNEIQTISFDPNTLELTISEGNTINIPLDVDDNDHSPFNELQELNYLPANGKLILSDANFVTLPIADIDPNNELQTIALNGNTLSLSNNGGQVDLSAIGGSSLWSQAANNDLFTQENVAIGLEESLLSTLEVKEDFSIRNADGNLTVDVFTNNSGGNFFLKKGTGASNFNTVALLSDNTQGGSVSLFNPNGEIQAKLFSSDVGGRLELFNPQGNAGLSILTEEFGALIQMSKPVGGDAILMLTNDNGGAAFFYGADDNEDNISAVVSIGRVIGNNERGSLKVGNTERDKLIEISARGGDAGGNTSGRVEGFNSQGNKMFDLGAVGDAQTKGSFSIFDADAKSAIRMTGKFGGEIILQSDDATNRRNVTIGAITGSDNRGLVTVHNTTGTDKAGMFVNGANQGVLFADVKNFRVDHPADDSKEIWYACVEGPEAAAYERGTAQLVNGEMTVTFPDHFGLIANYETMTVMLTPLSADCKGLAVIEKTATGFKVKELFQGTGTYQFDWEVKCVRKGYENYQPVRAKKDRM